MKTKEKPSKISLRGEANNVNFSSKLPIVEENLKSRGSTTSSGSNSGLIRKDLMVVKKIDRAPLGSIEEEVRGVLEDKKSTIEAKRNVISMLCDYIYNGSRDDFLLAHKILSDNVNVLTNLLDVRALSKIVLTEEQVKKHSLKPSEVRILSNKSKTAVNAIGEIILSLNGNEAKKPVERLSGTIIYSIPIVKTEALKVARKIISQHSDQSVKRRLLIEMNKIIKFERGITRDRTLEYLLRMASNEKLIESRNIKTALVHIFEYKNTDRNLDVLDSLVYILESKNPSLKTLKPVCLDMLKDIVNSERVENEIKKRAKKAIKNNTTFIKRMGHFVSGTLSQYFPPIITSLFRDVLKKPITEFIKTLIARILLRSL